LSARYSNSPALRLQAGKSPLRAALCGGLCLLGVYALWGVYTRGYPWLAMLLAPGVTGLLWRLGRDPVAGVELCWHRGVWTLERGGVRRPIAVTRRSTATPWVICLAFSDLSGASGGHLWIYSDSVSGEQWRRLRVRLTLLS